MKDILSQNKGPIIGGAIGLVVAILMLCIGFWKTLVIFFLIASGIIIGMVIDGNTWLADRINILKNKK